MPKYWNEKGRYLLYRHLVSGTKWTSPYSDQRKEAPNKVYWRRLVADSSVVKECWLLNKIRLVERFIIRIKLKLIWQ